ncbi:hypothetical protein E2C01_007585 [Portunus trituberculatus]|uniref:Uncharacterized protein n=1 Tax=Portunus trituberculatus TaxID=210409 RepID=A0A5B7CZM2_PORTR|nr:hypothetical protein [Portunus trituberculatus]
MQCFESCGSSSRLVSYSSLVSHPFLAAVPWPSPSCLGVVLCLTGEQLLACCTTYDTRHLIIPEDKNPQHRRTNMAITKSRPVGPLARAAARPCPRTLTFKPSKAAQPLLIFTSRYLPHGGGGKSTSRCKLVLKEPQTLKTKPSHKETAGTRS